MESAAAPAGRQPASPAGPLRGARRCPVGCPAGPLQGLCGVPGAYWPLSALRAGGRPHPGGVGLVISSKTIHSPPLVEVTLRGFINGEEKFGFGEPQNEEEKHEPIFCVRHHTRRALREPSQKEYQNDRKEMEAFEQCLTDTAVASTPRHHKPPDSEV